MRTGPNFRPPPRELVARIEARAPGIWRKVNTALDTSLRGIDATAVNWYRTAEHNQRVGGKVGSQHRWGMAWDLVVPPDQKLLAMQRLRRATFLVIDEGDHLHVQAFPAGVLKRAGIRPG